MHRDSNLLACVDGGGNLHVWDLEKTKQNIATAQPYPGAMFEAMHGIEGIVGIERIEGIVGIEGIEGM